MIPILNFTTMARIRTNVQYTDSTQAQTKRELTKKWETLSLPSHIARWLMIPKQVIKEKFNICWLFEIQKSHVAEILWADTVTQPRSCVFLRNFERKEGGKCIRQSPSQTIDIIFIFHQSSHGASSEIKFRPTCLNIKTGLTWEKPNKIQKETKLHQEGSMEGKGDLSCLKYNHL